VSLAALLLALVFAPGVLQAQRGAAPADGYLTGVVQGPSGPEAGVWVIAETKDLPTNFIKIVVTDDQGRFMVPELPAANYSVWVRGYGLADSAKVQTKPTPTAMTLRVQAAKTPQEAAKVYPGNYWLSMLEPPAKSEFPGTGNPPQGNGLGAAMDSQDRWVYSLKSDCNFCHQLGNQLTRSVDHVLKAKPELKTHAEAWEWRLGTGVRGTSMYSVLNNQGQARSLKVYADWTERVAKGEVPAVAPPRPKGVERNVVLTLWDWGTDHSFMHDEVTTDRHHPTVNGGGPVYAVSAGHGQLVILDPKTNRTEELDIPTREPREKVASRFPKPNRPSLWWGDTHLWCGPQDKSLTGPARQGDCTGANPAYNTSDPHNPMLDSKGRVWMTSKIRGGPDAAWCSDPSNKFAAWFPLRNSGRQASFYDPKTKQFTLIDTCYATHHLQFDNDANETVYFNELSGPIVGWIDSKIYDETKDEKKANGWCGQVVDTNGDGKITAPPWNQITGRGESILYSGDTAGGNAPAAGGGRARGAGGVPQAGGPDPKLDTLVSFSLYGVVPSPVDDSIWGASERYPGHLIRVDRGKNPPQSCMTEVYKVPAPGLDPRGLDVDRNGVVWTALAASSHLASFDRRKCKSLTGPRKTDGSDCPEGWTLYLTDGPKLKGTNIPSDFHYYTWVDQYNSLGLGDNKPMATGSNSDSILVLDPQTRTWVTLRVPYPLGFYARGLDGRIDDAKAGWKGRGLWANYGTHFVWHIEGGKGTKGKMVHFQLRDNPLQR
jgi:hypothetical protein